MLAVDAINSSLKRIVGYLNAISGPQTSVIAVEYARMYVDRLAIIPVAHRAAETLRGSYANRRPNVRLSELSEEDIQHLG